MGARSVIEEALPELVVPSNQLEIQAAGEICVAIPSQLAESFRGCDFRRERLRSMQLNLSDS
jgi:hypothetical protein